MYSHGGIAFEEEMEGNVKSNKMREHEDVVGMSAQALNRRKRDSWRHLRVKEIGKRLEYWGDRPLEARSVH
jgi:hypothetical protein